MKGYNRHIIWMGDSSLVVNIPLEYVQALDLKKGQSVNVTSDKRAHKIIIEPLEPQL